MRRVSLCYSIADGDLVAHRQHAVGRDAELLEMVFRPHAGLHVQSKERLALPLHRFVPHAQLDGRVAGGRTREVEVTMNRKMTGATRQSTSGEISSSGNNLMIEFCPPPSRSYPCDCSALLPTTRILLPVRLQCPFAHDAYPVTPPHRHRMSQSPRIVQRNHPQLVRHQT